MRTLVRESFRHVNNSVAARELVEVLYRDTTDKVPLFQAATGPAQFPNPIRTDITGNLAFYVDDGSYDFAVYGARVPFDIVTGVTSSVSRYTHTQATPSALWVVNHGLGTRPTVVLELDSLPGEDVWTDVHYTDLDSLTVEWPSPETGKAYIS